MRAQECGEDDCGYVRPGSVAYREFANSVSAPKLTDLTDGFEGADKAFLLEFAMPMDGNTDFQGDLPAIWILNAQIPLTVQYGTCNCWPGCGEYVTVLLAKAVLTLMYLGLTSLKLCPVPTNSSSQLCTAKLKEEILTIWIAQLLAP